MTQAEFIAMVSRTIRRGTVFDADIPGYALSAIETLESQHNWRHMWHESFQQTLPAGDSSVTFLGKLKSWRYMRFAVPADSGLSLAGRFAYVAKSQPEDIRSGLTLRSLATVKGWLNTASKIQLNGAFTVDTLYDIGWYQYSALDDASPWFNIVPGGAGILQAQTILDMLLLHRDEKVAIRAQATLDKKLPPLLESDLVHQFDSDDASMVPFTDEVQEDLFSLGEGGLP